MPLLKAELLILGGIVAILAVASITGAFLQLRVAAGEPHALIDNLNARIRAWWAMVAIITLAIWSGPAAIIWLFAFVSFQSLREFISLTYTRRGDHHALMLSFFVFLPYQYYLIAQGSYGMFAILIPVYAFLLLPISSLSADTSRFFERAAKVQWGLMICVYCISYVPALLMLKIEGFEGRNVLLIVFLLLTVQASDVLQYIWGKLTGRRPLSPKISPSKTLEGLIGGVLSSCALAAALWWITPFAPWQAALLALTINAMGFLGGLVLSAIKRDRGIKDWGTMIDGHGGMLDRVDSLSFAAPVFFHVVRYFWSA
ncbi:MAG: phosphatidate cytidylyltransferase [Rhodomicrobium sp.]